jgi:hypothetical protein
MQHQPSRRAWLKPSIAIVVVATILWLIVAGLDGYRIGYAPVDRCAYTTHVMLAIPMWKPCTGPPGSDFK